MEITNHPDQAAELPELPYEESAASFVGDRRNGVIFERTPVLQVSQLFASWDRHIQEQEPALAREFENEWSWRPNKWEIFSSSLDGLVDYLCVASKSNGPTIIPSKAADSVWHAWLEKEPESYAEFCKQNFGHYIRHIPNASLPEPLTDQDRDDRLARTWVGLFKHMGIDPNTMAVPPLFCLDRQVGFKGGFTYTSHAGHVAHEIVSSHDKVSRGTMTNHPGIHPARMSELGLITPQEEKAATNLMRLNPVKRWLSSMSYKAGTIGESENNIRQYRGKKKPGPDPSSSSGGCGSSCGGGCG